MNPVLENKLKELEQARDYECWYIVKQSTDFSAICYLVKFLQAYQSANKFAAGVKLEIYIKEQAAVLNGNNSVVNVTDTHRALQVAAFYGLIRKQKREYASATITDTFAEITSRCNGEYEKTDLYSDIIQRQIEKIFISSEIDEEYEGVRQEYRLYPVILLYKVLLEMGRSSGRYSINMTDYRYIVATTKRYEDFLDTLMQIKLLRTDGKAVGCFERYKTKFDNRMIQVLKQLPTLIIDSNAITLREECVTEVAEKVFMYESHPDLLVTESYLDFLGSAYKLTDFAQQVKNYDFSDRKSGGENIILYGVPGAGKSWIIEREYCKDIDDAERVVFYPDYTYSDFVGQIMPKIVNGTVEYRYSEGPFTKLLRKAYVNPAKMFYLIIEEINRGNAPAVFGDIFQLLDRDEKGNSRYAITNREVARIVYLNEEHKVTIPSNMTILCTMNTSDQNVFTLDTAFQRRWSMRLIKNKFHDNPDERNFAETKILDTDVTWEKFLKEVNKLILSQSVRMTSSEDKRLGTHFVVVSDLEFAANDEKQNRRFPEKVLKYLWDDAFKFNKENIFDMDKVGSLEDVIELFLSSQANNRFSVFKENIRDAFVS